MSGGEGGLIGGRCKPIPGRCIFSTLNCSHSNHRRNSNAPHARISHFMTLRCWSESWILLRVRRPYARTSYPCLRVEPREIASFWFESVVPDKPVARTETHRAGLACSEPVLGQCATLLQSETMRHLSRALVVGHHLRPGQTKKTLSLIRGSFF